MPKANPAKIKSALSNFFVPLAVLVLCVICIFLVVILRGQITEQKNQENYVAFGGKQIYVDLALTVNEQVKGLGGKESLAPGNGMLFVYKNPKPQCFWMKDMNFAIDIVWINARNMVTKIDKAVVPETYPTIYCSEKPVKYVLEIPANTADPYKIFVSSQMTKNF